MASNFDTALAQFAATTAALNAKALHRAGLLEDFELGVMNVYLDFVGSHADLDKNKEKQSIYKSLRECLPLDADRI